MKERNNETKKEKKRKKYVKNPTVSGQHDPSPRSLTSLWRKQLRVRV